MARSLDVYLHGHFVGNLIQDDGGQMVFEYAQSWLDDPDAFPLSHSLPLRAGRFTQNECRGFFGGTLPEEVSRKVIARILGISDRNDFAMLEHIGGECAGAVTFLSQGTALLDVDSSYRQLTEQELARILRELPRRPLMAGEDGIRLSLAGAQDKIAVRFKDGQTSIPLGSAPSTHIIKPAIATYEGVVFNEALCMSLAATVGLPTAKTSIGRVDEIDYLLIERFDRQVDPGGHIHRLHQEDFCQALGLPPEIKYQEEGGPSLGDAFALLRDVSSSPVLDLRALLDAVMFNLIIGNHDAHAKNFSLLYMPDQTTSLAPLYDLVSTVFYPELTAKMAMKIGGADKSDLVFPDNVARLAKDAGLAPAPTLMRVPALTAAVLQAVDAVEKPHKTSEEVADLIRKRCSSIMSRFKRNKRS